MNDRVLLTIDSAHCSLCGAPNDCALAREGADGDGPPCWCVDRLFPESLLARARVLDGGKACICRRCLEASGAHEG